MKLRLGNNTVRFRVSRNEADRLAVGETLREEVVLGPNNRITYQIAVRDDLKQAQAVVSADSVSLLLPIPLAAKWARCADTAISVEQCGDGGSLKVLLDIEPERWSPLPICGSSLHRLPPVF